MEYKSLFWFGCVHLLCLVSFSRVYSSSLVGVQLLTAKVHKPTKPVQRSKTMTDNRPPVPVKPDHVKKLPVPRPRSKPPPKPLPYNVHREISRQKPSPAPRKTSGQASATTHAVIPGSPIRGYVEIKNGGDNENSVPDPHAQITPKPLRSQLAIDSRPRLNTPHISPDPDTVLNGATRTPLVPQVRGGVAAPSRTHTAVATEINSGASSPSSPEGGQPSSGDRGGSHTSRESTNSPKDGGGGGGGGGGGVGGRGLYEAAFGDFWDKSGEDADEGDMYSTIVDVPRGVLTPTPPQRTPTPRSSSLTPPVPLPRSPPVTAPVPTATSPPPSPAEEYSVTIHVVERQKLAAKPKPTPVDSYSMLKRPDQPSKPFHLTSVTPDPSSSDVGKMYSSLEVNESSQTPPLPLPPKPVSTGLMLQ